MPQRDPSRTEKATPRRRRKAREEGNVPRSEEVSKVVVLVVGVVSLRFFIKFIGKNMFDIFIFIFHSFNMEISKNSTYYLLIYCMQKILIILLPVLLLIAIASVVTIRLQTGHVFTSKVFTPKWENFNPINNIKNRFFSFKTIIEILKSSFQVVLVGIVAYFAVKNQIKYLPSLFFENVSAIISDMLFLIYKVTWILLIPLIIIAIIHLFYTRWDYEESIKMTKQEVKDEHKQLYGSPEIKREQRKRMQQVMMSRMMSEVPKADVVITNPTHIAVALRYEINEAPAPIVVAKGAGLIAERIKNIAKEHNIPIKEDKPLAQALYKSVEVGEMIPEELYQAVASVLASLEKFRKKYARR